MSYKRGRSDDEITVEMDPGSTGKWVTCQTVKNLESLPREFLKKARLGISATTGHLADNHDVLALEVYGSIEDAKEADKTRKEEEKKVSEGEEDPAAMNKRIHELEHELERLAEKTENTLKKIEKHEEKLDSRLGDLEYSIENSIKADVRQLSAGVDRRLKRDVDSHKRSIDRDIQDILDSRDRSWRWTIGLFFLLLCAVGGGFYKQYKFLRKSHLL